MVKQKQTKASSFIKLAPPAKAKNGKLRKPGRAILNFKSNKCPRERWHFAQTPPHFSRQKLRQRRKMQRQAVFSALILFSTLHTAAGAETVAACDTVCGGAYKLERRTEHYSNELQAARQGLTRLQGEFMTVLLAEAQATGITRRRLIPVLAAGAELLSACETEAANKPDATEKLRNASATAAALLRALHYISKSPGLYHITWSSDGNFNSAAKTQADFGKINVHEGCSEQAGEDKPVDERSSSKQQPEIPDLLTKIHLTDDCKQNSGGTGCAGNTLNDGSQLKFGLTLSKSESAAAGKFASTWNSVIKVTEADCKLATEALKDANAAISDAKTTPATSACLKSLTKYSDVSSTPSFKLFFLKALGKKAAAEQIQGDDSYAVNTEIVKAYGEGGANYDTVLWREIKATQIQKK
uniref:Variant surface glycoprotein 1125.2616 n=1 Tax=Trypanosoma brucei TaxID=5691 RepID=A0A1J0R891_9TRYP|nr:variant surface glycoprotein 1125.2616 [Trypanosoma brucei]